MTLHDVAAQREVREARCHPAMANRDIHNPFFFYRGRRFEAVIGTSDDYRHAFGNVGGFTVRGVPPGKRGPHQLLTLDTRDPVLAGIFPDLPLLPLFYSFHYEDGTVKYELTDPTTISITELSDQDYDVNWPYTGYPEVFPVQSFTLTEPTECDLESFEKEVWQGIDRRWAEHFIAIIPPSDTYGVNLWDKNSNCDFVHVKCFIEPGTGRAVIYNECD